MKRPLFCLLAGIFISLPVHLIGAAITYSNPVLPSDYPDPAVIRVGSDYWATATTSEWAPLFPILHSKDLLNWTHVANVFETPPAWSGANYWAPEIWEHRGRYYIYYVGRKKGGPLSVAVATADKPTGPWTDHGPFISQAAGSIDAVPVLDEKGEPYLIWKEDGNSRKLPTIIWIQKLAEDCTSLVGEMKEIMRNDAPWEGAVVEGPFVVRQGEWFYMFYSGNACCGRGCNYALGVARAKKLVGPWEKNPRNPILGSNETWKCPGHGSIVRDPQGRDLLLYHAYHSGTFVYVGRQGLLDEVKWNDDWPTINSGRGPSTNAAAPWATKPQQLPGAFVDQFTSPALRPEWQWPQNNQPRVRIDREGKGLLMLSPGKPEYAKDVAGGVLAIKTISGDYTARALLRVSELKAGIHAGLSAYGDRENALGLSIQDQKATVWRRQRNKHEVLSTKEAPAGSDLQLRMDATGGHRFRFSLSPDGKQWTQVGEMDVEGQHLPPWDRGVRVALTVGGAEDATAAFDWLRLDAKHHITGARMEIAD